ncbi:MAG: hypothetical protein HY849_10690 [Nitrosomonadales bacterium]|nr:hypothetical protein [Nitrosomonadales bacterium]
MTTGAGRTIQWTSFNIPSQIVSCKGGDPSACKTTRFTYNPEHERTVENQTDGEGVPDFV